MLANYILSSKIVIFTLGSMDTNEFDCMISFVSKDSLGLIMKDVMKAIDDGYWKYIVWDNYGTMVELRVERNVEILRDRKMLSSNYEKLDAFLCEKGFRQHIDYQRGRIYTKREAMEQSDT